jgi:hypothetical protein
MQFHLNIQPNTIPLKISYTDKLLFVGSCFSENIGKMLLEHKFNTLINPNGILFNPFSIFDTLSNIIHHKTIQAQELFLANSVWNHWNYHSRFSIPDKEICTENINKSISEAHEFLKQTHTLFITFGSAYVYTLKSSGEIVANCHKVPQQQFNKQLLDIDQIVNKGNEFILLLKEFNPNAKIIFTVSPVRYIRDGIVENNRSKARLIEAVHCLTQRHSNSFYFPAYELVIDDLRDYRFYESDLVHPNEQAILYVFEKLKDLIFDSPTTDLFNTVSSIIRATKHKPFNPDSEEHKKFKAHQFQLCKQISEANPHLNLSGEMKHFTSK